MIDKPAMTTDYAARVAARKKQNSMIESRLRADLWAIEEARKKRARRKRR